MKNVDRHRQFSTAPCHRQTVTGLDIRRFYVPSLHSPNNSNILPLRHGTISTQHRLMRRNWWERSVSVLSCRYWKFPRWQRDFLTRVYSIPLGLQVYLFKWLHSTRSLFLIRWNNSYSFFNNHDYHDILILLLWNFCSRSCFPRCCHWYLYAQKRQCWANWINVIWA